MPKITDEELETLRARRRLLEAAETQQRRAIALTTATVNVERAKLEAEVVMLLVAADVDPSTHEIDDETGEIRPRSTP